MSKLSSTEDSNHSLEKVPVTAQRTKRSLLFRVPFTSTKEPPPPKQSLDDADLIPEATANFFKLVTFGWVTPLLGLGYSRPLVAHDLYKLQESRGAARIAEKINASFDRRNKQAQEASLIWALNDSIAWWFWSGGLLKVISDTAQVTSPLFVKAIINFATESYIGHKTGARVPSVGVGFGYAFGLIALQIIGSLCMHHFFYRATSTGVLLRGGLITAIYARSLKLTSRARSTLTNGKLVNHISTDVSRIDFCAGYFHMAWTAPIQMIICLILLILNLGPSALAGFAFFVLATPVQTMVMKRLFMLRKKSMMWTDKRAKLLQELLGGMKVIKYFAWEAPMLARIFDYRKKELAHIRSLLLIRSANNAVALSMPVLASVVAFVTYSLTGHDLEPSLVFASLSLFTLLRLPLMFLPVSFSAIADAANATSRLHGVFEAELLTETLSLDRSLDVAVEITDASFTWDAPPPEEETTVKRKRPYHTATKGSVRMFQVKDLNIRIPRGQLVAIVGAVGCGKTSFLQGIIGEMRRTGGSVKFGGTVGYCPQSAWIQVNHQFSECGVETDFKLQNATIRENICFGRPFEEEKYWKAVNDSCLGPDLEMLPNADLTEVGEKGISLSGGQKQRVNICRAIYCDADIQIFDDPLSALDAHVGKAVFQNVLRNNSGKTRLLVTHALHFLPQVDYIYTIADGRVAERGTYTELMNNAGEFAKFVKEFGAKEEKKEAEDAIADANEKTDKGPKKKAIPGAALMQTEERNTGAISWEVYKEYSKAGKGPIVLPLLFLSLVLIQGATVMSSYWLVYWQEEKWPRPQGFYMGIYAFLGTFQAISFFTMGSMFAFLTFFASQRLHRAAITRVMHAPMSFFETTPLGRIMNRFSKDIDTMDNLLGDSLRMFASTASSIIGAIILISIVLPWFLIGVVCIIILYVWAAAFYRASARELKRLDAVLRSSLYSHFSESLSGLATIRAYGESERFRLDNEARVDIENRAYWLTVTNQRWLGIRLDCLGALLTFTVSMLAVGTRFTISPAQTGLVLSYILSVQQAFGWLVRQSAEVENNMNSVERIVHYVTAIEQEAPHELPKPKLPSQWPPEGRVELNNVVLCYRHELPAVLKGISMIVAAGEKIGIVGRTGAGKSSIMTALYRLVELTDGSITIDGTDISKVGLTDLRSGLAIIPQDPLLFSGTLRTNLDPFGLHDDAKLWDALKRSYLVENTSKHDSLSTTDEVVPSNAHTLLNRFTLDSIIEDEGGNLSIGQRSLVSLARALVKDSKVIILDEATASVDYETDRNIQDTITNEFKDKTVLCIAHRLKTIIGYDRICVLDAGQIVEFDTPVRLYHKPDGLFRGMCERSSITLEDLQLAGKTGTHTSLDEI
ncbi:ABC transporter C family member 2 [Termitomyces sp. J132]|nr:ABC transporter C family member 2 [Termitomyces sp. J132]